MNYRKIGRYGIKISEVALGSWLTYGGMYGQDEADACVRKAYELGINYFDTADVYGSGQTHAGAAEEVLAHSLAGFPRSSYVRPRRRSGLSETDPTTGASPGSTSSSSATPA